MRTQHEGPSGAESWVLDVAYVDGLGDTQQIAALVVPAGVSVCTMADEAPWRGPHDVDVCGRKMTFAEYDAENRASEAAREERRRARAALLGRRPRHVNPRRAPAPPSTRTPPNRQRGAGRPKGAARRSSDRSGSSGDDGPGEPPPRLALALPPRALYRSVAASSPEYRGEEIA